MINMMLFNARAPYCEALNCPTGAPAMCEQEVSQAKFLVKVTQTGLGAIRLGLIGLLLKLQCLIFGLRLLAKPTGG